MSGKRVNKCRSCGYKGDLLEMFQFHKEIEFVGYICFKCACEFSIRCLEGIKCHHSKWSPSKRTVSIVGSDSAGCGDFEILLPIKDWGRYE